MTWSIFYHRNRLDKLTLALCGVVLSFGVLKASKSLTTGYELSIYESTPLIFWISAVLTLLISLSYIIILKRKIKISCILVSLASLSVAGLPITRGYYFVSEADAMTHLGTIKDLLYGTIDPLNMLYPLSHTLTAGISLVGGYSPENSVLIVNIIFILIYIVSISVLFHKFLETSGHVGLVSAVLFLPIGRNGLHFAPNLFGRLYLPFLILISLYVYMGEEYAHRVLFTLSSISLLFLHPQIFAVFTLVVVSFSISKLFLISKSNRKLSNNGGLLLGGIICSLLLFSWILSKSAFINNFQIIILKLLSPSPGSGSVSSIHSLRLAGGSVFPTIIKLYAAKITFIILSIATMYKSLKVNVGDENISTLVGFYTNPISLIITGTITIFVLFSITFVASENYMRYFTASMPLVTILGGYYLYNFILKGTGLRPILACLVIICLVFSSLAIFYPSPYIYQSNSQVPESSVNGYSLAFSYSSTQIDFLRVRSPVFRYCDATKGMTECNFRKYTGGRWRATTPYHFANHNLSQYYKQKKYLAITIIDRFRDPIAYNGLRYNKSDFRYVERSNRINKVMSTGGFDLYLIL